MNSKPEANWCGLPVEMQLECIKRMDFKTRIRLRSVSKTEKSLVDSAPKYRFDSVKIEWDPDYSLMVKCHRSNELEIDYDEGFKWKYSHGFPFSDKGCQLALQVLKFSNTEALRFDLGSWTEDDIPKFLVAISEFTPFHVKKLHLHCNTNEIAHFFLTNTQNVETLVLDGSMSENKEIRVEDLMELPLVINSKKVQNRMRYDPNCNYQLIQKWIECDAEVGTTLQAYLFEDYREDIDSLANNAIYKKPREMRLGTNNDSKHILVRALDVHKEFLSFVIIPADQKESEYEKEDFEWMREIEEDERRHSKKCGDHVERKLLSLGPNFISNALDSLQIDIDPEPFLYEDYF